VEKDYLDDSQGRSYKEVFKLNEKKEPDARLWGKSIPGQRK
jgi:hypothetical protein